MKQNLKINSKRLLETLHSTCNWGAAHRYGTAATETGMARLALNKDDFAVRTWLSEEMKSLGCSEIVDAMGNMFFIRKGSNEGLPTAMGSHLDTQPMGGRYDGILGVMSAVEAIRTMNDLNITTKYPVAVVNWTNEEGARFPKSMMGSSVWAEFMSVEEAYQLQDVADKSITVYDELKKGGYLGEVPVSYKSMPLGAHFELHIEQGPILENEDKRVGVVVGGQAFQWIMVTLEGRASHTGSTPFSARSDALLAASKIIVACNEIARAHDGLASTGLLSLAPGSVNTTAGTVEFSIDARHMSGPKLFDELLPAIRQAAEKICKECDRGVKIKDWDVVFESPEIKFNSECIAAVTEAATAVVGDSKREIYSGAGHDSCPVSQRCPTSMIFVPCKDGLSHHPTEYSSPQACIDGAQVLLNAVVAYDAARKS